MNPASFDELRKFMEQRESTNSQPLPYLPSRPLVPPHDCPGQPVTCPDCGRVLWGRPRWLPNIVYC